MIIFVIILSKFEFSNSWFVIDDWFVVVSVLSCDGVVRSFDSLLLVLLFFLFYLLRSFLILVIFKSIL